MKKILIIMTAILSLSMASDTQKVTITIQVPECSKLDNLQERCMKDFLDTKRVYLSVPESPGKSIIYLSGQDDVVDLPLIGNTKTPLIFLEKMMKSSEVTLSLVLAHKIDKFNKTTFYTKTKYSGQIDKLIIMPEFKIKRKTSVYLDVNTSFDLPLENKDSNYVLAENINARIYLENGKMAIGAISLDDDKLRLTMVIPITHKDKTNKPGKYDFWMLDNLPVKVSFIDNKSKRFTLTFSPDNKTFGVENSIILKAVLVK